MQADNRLLTNLIKCEKEHHSALLALLVRSHTSLAALSAYASVAAPPVAQALLGCIQAFAAADEGLRGYAAAVEGWKEELKEVKRVEDEYKAVVRDKDILVGRLIKASKQKIPTASLQAGPAPIPNASYLAPSSPSASSYSLPTSQPYQYTPTPHATQHINSKLALAQRELHACEAHLAGKEAELAEVRRSAMTEGMVRRCRAMADVGHVWRERGEQGMRALDELGREAAGTAPPQQPYYTPPRRSLSSHSGSSIAPSHSASQQRHTRAQSPFYSPRAQSPATYQTLAGGYQHSHPLPALPERDSWHGDPRPASYHPESQTYAQPEPRRPISLIDPPRALRTFDPRRPLSSNDLPAPPEEEHVTFDLPPPHSIGDAGEFIPLGRPVSSHGHGSGEGREGKDSKGWTMRDTEWSSSEDEANYQVVENDRQARWEPAPGVDEEILRAVEKMGVVVPPKPPPITKNTPPTPPETASPGASPVPLPDVRIVEATPQKPKGKKKATKRREGAIGGVNPTGTTSAPAPKPVDKALPEPVTVYVPERAASPATERVASPVPAPVAAPVPAPVVAPASASPAPRSISPAPAPTPTLTAPTPLPAATPSRSAPIATGARLDSDPDLVAQSETEDKYHTDVDADVDTDVPATEPVRATTDDVIHQLGDRNEPRADDPAPIEIPATEAVLATTTVPAPTVPAVSVTPPSELEPVVPTVSEPVKSLDVATESLTVGPAQLATPELAKSMPTTTPKNRIVSSASEPLVQNRKPKLSKRVTADSEGEGRKKPEGKKSKRKGHSRQSSTAEPRPIQHRKPSAEDRADLAALLRDSDAPSPHVHFPAPGGVYVPSAPAPPRQPGSLYLPSSGTTRSDVGPARAHFDVPPSPVASVGRARSGSATFFGRVAGLFGRKKPVADGYLSSGGQAWRTRTDGNISRGRGEDSSDDEPANLVTVTNGPRTIAIDNPRPPARAPPTSAPLGRKLTKADKGQTLRVGPPESPSRTRKPSLTEEHIVPAKPKRKTKTKSVDGGVSRRTSLKSNTSEARRASSDVGRTKEPASLMAIVEGPGLVLPSDLAKSESPRLAVPPTVVSPTTTAAPRPVRATSPTPLKSALRNRTPSPLPPMSPQVPSAAPSPRVVSPATLSPPTTSPPAQSPRNSIAESVYETGEEDFDEGDASDATASGRPPVPPSPGAALLTFKDGLGITTSNTAGSVSTAGPLSATSARKSVRINPDPPEMSATPAATPGSELEEEPSWTRNKPAPESSSGGWTSRIGRGWEDSSDESDEEYERVRRALESSSKHMEEVNAGKSRR